MVQLVDEFRRLHRLGFEMLGVLADHARSDVAGQNFNAKRIESGPDRGNLVQDLNAIPLLFDHSLDTSDLPGNPINSSPDFFACLLFHQRTYTLYRYYASGAARPHR
jgi:hypothetical protein